MYSTHTDMFMMMAVQAENDKETGTPRNRSIDVEKLGAVIDPDGIHVCTFSFVHSHVGGAKVDPHLRTQWLVKLKGTDDPITLWLDVDADPFLEWTCPILDNESPADLTRQYSLDSGKAATTGDNPDFEKDLTP